MQLLGERTVGEPAERLRDLDEDAALCLDGGTSWVLLNLKDLLLEALTLM